MRIMQSQKTTEYSREPKQKQANVAQVTEFTVYQGRVKQQEQNWMTYIKCTKESDRNDSALRTSEQHEQNKMTDVSSRGGL